VRDTIHASNLTHILSRLQVVNLQTCNGCGNVRQILVNTIMH